MWNENENFCKVDFTVLPVLTGNKSSMIERTYRVILHPDEQNLPNIITTPLAPCDRKLYVEKRLELAEWASPATDFCFRAMSIWISSLCNLWNQVASCTPIFSRHLHICFRSLGISHKKKKMHSLAWILCTLSVALCAWTWCSCTMHQAPPAYNAQPASQDRQTHCL